MTLTSLQAAQTLPDLSEQLQQPASPVRRSSNVSRQLDSLTTLKACQLISYRLWGGPALSLGEQSRQHLQKEQRKDRATPIYSVGEEVPRADHCQLAVLLHLQWPREQIHSFWTCRSHNDSSILCTLQYSARLTVRLISLQVAKRAPMPSSEGPFSAPRDAFASLATTARASRAACCSSASFFHASSGCLALARICFELYLSKNSSAK